MTKPRLGAARRVARTLLIHAAIGPPAGLIAGTIIGAFVTGEAPNLSPAAFVAAYLLGIVPALLLGAIFAALRGAGVLRPVTLVGLCALSAALLSLALSMVDPFVTLEGVILIAAVYGVAAAVAAALSLRFVPSPPPPSSR